MKKMLITGIKGFIGYHCYEYFKKEYEIIGIDNCSGLGCEDRNVPYFEDDLLTCILPDNIDIVLHLAAKAGVRESWTKLNDYYKNNVLLTKRIFDYYKCKILYASSSSVIDMISPYAMTKAVCEQLAPQNAIGMRFFTVYGPKGRPDMLYRMAEENRLKYITKHYRDFTHIDTLLPMINKVVKKGVYGEIYEMGEGKSESVINFLSRNNFSIDLPIKEVTGESVRTCSKQFIL